MYALSCLPAQELLLLLYFCFTTALLLLYYCFTSTCLAWVIYALSCLGLVDGVVYVCVCVCVCVCACVCLYNTYTYDTYICAGYLRCLLTLVYFNTAFLLLYYWFTTDLLLLCSSGYLRCLLTLVYFDEIADQIRLGDRVDGWDQIRSQRRQIRLEDRLD
jgi:hypothetical protein